MRPLLRRSRQEWQILKGIPGKAKVHSRILAGGFAAKKEAEARISLTEWMIWAYDWANQVTELPPAAIIRACCIIVKRKMNFVDVIHPVSPETPFVEFDHQSN